MNNETLVQMPLGGMKNFIYLFACPETGEAAVVDPAWDADAILQRVKEKGWHLRRVLLTHTHPDHVNAVTDVCEAASAPVHVHHAEKDRVPEVSTEVLTVHDGDRIALGRSEIEVFHTPGHSPGAVCYRYGPWLFSGDTLFVGRTGRMVFPGSSQEDMYRSLARLRKLPGELVVLPGHDYGETPTSTLAHELETSPFFLAGSLDEFQRVADAWEKENG